MKLKISQDLQDKLICPVKKGKLLVTQNYLKSDSYENIHYPVVDGIPILINFENSLFSINDFLNKQDTTIFISKEDSIFKRLISKITPTISTNLMAEKNYAMIASFLPTNAKILVIGGSIKGYGMDPIYLNRSFEVVGSDVSFGPYTKIICDAHDIPFKDETFECVIIQAVLEHVLDPQRCVSELHRVLKENGLVYSETPFMQQVHMKQYDFMRFTHLGHRRLFKNFEEIESGLVAGPGSALAWSFTYFLRSFGWSQISIKILTKLGYFIAFFLKYFDYVLKNKPGSYDSASGFYFLGRKSNNTLSDKDLIKGFRGIV